LLLARSQFENRLIVGIDEAGRGPLAGPVTAGAVILPVDFNSILVNDSKKLSPSKRDLAYNLITESAIAWSVVAVGAKRIDKVNIRVATRLAMEYALKKISNFSLIDGVVIDGNMKINTKFFQQTVVKGDSIYYEIAAASILAKVVRDRYMNILDQKYPDYGFAIHKGYPTSHHLVALAKFGVSPIHRFSYAPVKRSL
jgi:ribonuclease HII